MQIADSLMVPTAALSGNAGSNPSVEIERTRLLYSHLPTSQLVVLLNGAILALVQSAVVPASHAAAWLGILLAVTLIRIRSAGTFAPEALAPTDISGWQHRFTRYAALSGAVWGTAAYLLYPAQSVIHQVFLAFVLGGMVAGSVTVLTPAYRAFAAFAALSLLPLIFRYLIAGDRVHYAMSAMAVIFLLGMLAIGRRIHETIITSLRLRFENVAMIEELLSAKRDVEDVNADLRSAQEALRHSNEELEKRVADRTRALRAMDRRKDEFLAVLSHELRNPLAPIRNAIYILDKADPQGDSARQARAVIQRQTQYIARLVDDLLDVTRIARGKIELRRESTDLAELVTRTAEDHAAMFRKLGIAFDIDVPRSCVWGTVDRTRIAQLLGNLLHNAANFTPVNGAVRVSLQTSGSNALIRVADTGAGIEGDLLPVLFEAFTQGRRSLARTEGGLGLGLALVKGIAELHGGSVAVRSDGPGKGATFEVRIPVDALPATAREAQAETAAARQLRVLIVDDNRDAADTLAAVVTLFGHKAQTAYDGATALSSAVLEPPDVLLCDIGLPDMTGHEVAASLRAAGISARIYAVSGYAQPDDIAAAKSAGFDGHIAKPVDPDALRRVFG